MTIANVMLAYRYALRSTRSAAQKSPITNTAMPKKRTFPGTYVPTNAPTAAPTAVPANRCAEIGNDAPRVDGKVTRVAIAAQ
jgi:hypothetical protein